MTDATARPASSGAFHVGLHACRDQAELEQRFGEGLALLLPGADVAVSVREEDGEVSEVRIVAGAGCPFEVGELVALPQLQQAAGALLPILYGEHRVGELWLRASLSDSAWTELEDALAHFGTALVNLTLAREQRVATDDYCGALQALEEGIVLFQEPDQEALTARLLSLASGMVGAAAGALYVHEEVGDASTALTLTQSMGIPDALLASFRAVDGGSWLDHLVQLPAQVAERDANGVVAGLAPDSVPAVLERLVVVPLRYHGVPAGVCVLFNPAADVRRDVDGRLQSFGRLAAALLHRLSLERVREESALVARELQIAEAIQQRLVPQEAPPSAAFEFAWRSVAAKSIGGDYVDFLVSEQGEVSAVVADASGHGINSALLMASFRANYRAASGLLEVDELASSLNDEVTHEVGLTGMFVTAALARLDPAGRTLTLCSAGHNPVLLVRAGGAEAEQLGSHGTPMGFLGGARYGRSERPLSSGDLVVLYTDGVTEATRADAEMFGEERLVEVVRRHARGTADEVLAAVLDAVGAFRGRETQEDDVSLMVVRVR